jgi:hypothetical protein
MSERLEWNDADEAWFQDMKAEKEYYDKLAMANTEYREKWPNYCKQCSGWGYSSWTEYGQQFVETCGCVWVQCPRCYANNPVANVHEGEHCDDIVAIKCANCSFELYKTEGLS